MRTGTGAGVVYDRARRRQGWAGRTVADAAEVSGCTRETAPAGVHALMDRQHEGGGRGWPSGVLSDVFGTNGRRTLDGWVRGLDHEALLASLSHRVAYNLDRLGDALALELSAVERWVLMRPAARA